MMEHKASEIEAKCSRQSLMRKLMAHSFAADDLLLFLDTHPHSQEALDRYHKEVAEYEKLKEKYESHYGPLRACDAPEKTPWQWIKSPWTWEGGLY